MTNLSNLLSQSGYGIGEINAIDKPNSADSWGVSGAGISVATSTDSADLPLEGMIASACKITPASGTPYAYRRFTIAEALKGYNLKLEWWQRCHSNYTSGDLKVDLYYYADSNYTSGTRIIPINGATTTNIVKTNGKFTLTFAAPTSTVYLEIRVTRVAGVSPVSLSSVVVGPGIQPQGSVIGDWVSFTPTGNCVTNTTYTGQYRRVGNCAEINVKMAFAGSPGIGAVAINLNNPTGLTTDTSKLPASGLLMLVGNASLWDSSGSANYNFPIQAGTTNVSMLAATAGYVTDATPVAFASGDILSFHYTIPVAEWSGSGTVQLAQNDVEFASNSNTTDAPDTTSFVYGPAGSTFPGTLTAARKKRVRFQNPIQPGDKISIEIGDTASGPWHEMTGDQELVSTASVGIFNDTANAGIGKWMIVSGSTLDIDVVFGRYRLGTSNWATNLGYWRVRKTSAGAAVGFGLASADSAGLLSKYAEGIHSSTFSGTNVTTSGSYDLVYTKVGRLVTLEFPDITVTMTGTAVRFNLTTVLPVGLRPARELYCPVNIWDNGATANTPGMIAVKLDGNVYIYYNGSGGTWGATANNGLRTAVVTYRV